VGRTDSIVEVGIAVGGMLVGAGVEGGSITGTRVAVAVQAVRRKKRIGMIFFMMTVCHCEEGWWLSSPMFFGAYRNHQKHVNYCFQSYAGFDTSGKAPLYSTSG
jgi:hypothetical protein